MTNERFGQRNLVSIYLFQEYIPISMFGSSIMAFIPSFSKYLCRTYRAFYNGFIICTYKKDEFATYQTFIFYYVKWVMNMMW